MICAIEKNTSIEGSRVVRVRLIEKVEFEKRLERGEEVSHAAIWRKRVTDRKEHPVQRPSYGSVPVLVDCYEISVDGAE